MPDDRPEERLRSALAATREEAVAKALWDASEAQGGDGTPWERATDELRDQMLGFARAALSAARPSSPTPEETPRPGRLPCDGSGGFGPKAEGVIGWMACPGCVNCTATTKEGR